jgi:dTDP-glucose 4,6-dehydratase
MAQMPRKKTLLLTGGAGFIGSQFATMLVSQTDWHVINLDKLTYAGRLSSLKDVISHPRHHFVHGDICDAQLLQHLFAEYQPSSVLHLAAETHVDRSIDGSSPFLTSNVCGTHILLEAVLQAWRTWPPKQKAEFRFLHISTDEVHGSLSENDPPFTETTNYAPRSPYSATKAASDHLVRAWHHTYGLPTLISHSSNNYGPRQFPEKLIPLAILKMLHGQPIPLYGDGHHIRDWLHVMDHCRALISLLESGSIGETYLIGSGQETRNRDLLFQLCASMDEIAPRPDGNPHHTTITRVADRPGHDERYAIDPQKIKNSIAWKPSIDLATGLSSTIQWYQENTSWWQEILDTNHALQRHGHPHI